MFAKKIPIILNNEVIDLEQKDNNDLFNILRQNMKASFMKYVLILKHKEINKIVSGVSRFALFGGFDKNEERISQIKLIGQGEGIDNR